MRAPAVVLATVLVLVFGGPHAGAQDDGPACATRLPVSVARLSPFALAYQSQLQFRVRSEDPLRDVRVQVYSFSGQRVAGESIRVLRRGSSVLHLALRSGLRAGGYTVAVSGRAVGCPRARATGALRLRNCIGGLGVQFPRRPGGTAADYGRYVTFRYRVGRFGPVRRASASLFTFGGSRIGTVGIKRLEGEGKFTVPLRSKLARGGYTLVLRGYLDQQPFACGKKDDLARVFFR